MGVSSRVTKIWPISRLIFISINAMSKVTQKKRKKTSKPILRTGVSKESGGHTHKQTEINL